MMFINLEDQLCSWSFFTHTLFAMQTDTSSVMSQGLETESRQTIRLQRCIYR